MVFKRWGHCMSRIYHRALVRLWKEPSTLKESLGKTLWVSHETHSRSCGSLRGAEPCWVISQDLSQSTSPRAYAVWPHGKSALCYLLFHLCKSSQLCLSWNYQKLPNNISNGSLVTHNNWWFGITVNIFQHLACARFKEKCFLCRALFNLYAASVSCLFFMSLFLESNLFLLMPTR